MHRETDECMKSYQFRTNFMSDENSTLFADFFNRSKNNFCDFFSV